MKRDRISFAIFLSHLLHVAMAHIFRGSLSTRRTMSNASNMMDGEGVAENTGRGYKLIIFFAWFLSFFSEKLAAKRCFRALFYCICGFW